ncbi:NAD(P)/FAD-dependent oxidoreductase [Yimella sp. cx-51]|uniref:flavin-containing monooxygenase n=1 Tax=Yimella sp. cx-51 TaxID=2770551 RepID=UPI001FCBB2BF|nr:NAD(P)/FAD-dependent oxidoreductase [Yimella sp. cx-51]
MSTSGVDHDLVVVGAGFSGIAMTIAARAAGRDVLVLEKADEIGGTWRDNRYPGVACDVESHLYSYSFELNPDWSRAYAPGDEIQDYLLYVVEKYGVRPHVRFGTTVQQAWWDADHQRWEVAFGTGNTLETVTCRDLVLAVGSLHTPVAPHIDGLELFAGEVMHTATWSPGTSVLGKRVGVIGTGASAVQVIPALAEEASTLTVFQRTPTWVLPKNDHEIPESTSERYERHPALMKAQRAKIRAANETRALGFTKQPALLKAVSLRARAHLRSAISDPQLRAALTPDYTMGCKRIPLSDNYFQALARRNVRLQTAPIAYADEAGIVTQDGSHHGLDLLVLATGFDPVQSWKDTNVYGLGHASLSQRFEDGVDSYYGVTVPDFPNLFLLLGPNAELGHTSVLLMMEAQVELIMKLLAERDRRGASMVAVRPQVVPAFMAEIDRRSERSVWQQGGCHSWYLDAHGANRTLWPGTVGEFERRVTNPEWVDYEFTS